MELVDFTCVRPSMVEFSGDIAALAKFQQESAIYNQYQRIKLCNKYINEIFQ